MAQAKISDKYQVVIPKAVRQRTGVRVGQTLDVRQLDDAIVLIPQRTRVKRNAWYKALTGLGKDVWDDIDPVVYVRALRDEWK